MCKSQWSEHQLLIWVLLLWTTLLQRRNSLVFTRLWLNKKDKTPKWSLKQWRSGLSICSLQESSRFKSCSKVGKYLVLQVFKEKRRRSANNPVVQWSAHWFMVGEFQVQISNWGQRTFSFTSLQRKIKSKVQKTRQEVKDEPVAQWSAC